jgi:hypothetical protein
MIYAVVVVFISFMFLNLGIEQRHAAAEAAQVQADDSFRLGYLYKLEPVTTQNVNGITKVTISGDIKPTSNSDIAVFFVYGYPSGLIGSEVRYGKNGSKLLIDNRWINVVDR